MNGWAKIKEAASFSGVSERTLRSWLKMGLKYSKAPTGAILIQYSSINEFLHEHEVHKKVIDMIVAEVEKELIS